MRRAWLSRGRLAAALAATLLLACTETADGPGKGGGRTSSGGDGGAGGGGPSGGSGAGALPASTFLFVTKASADSDVLRAFDTTTGDVRTVTDLRGDGSEGWPIGGYAISPDRSRIVLATLYAPTKADNDTKIATRRLYTLSPDGSDLLRITPTFPNTGGGKSGFVIEVRDPVFSGSGADVLFNYGEYWYEGNSLEGGSAVWSVASDASALPALFKAPSPCSYVDPSVDPATGKVTITQYACVPGSGETGIYRYAANGGGPPELLVGETASMRLSLETPRWTADGSGFVFVGEATVPAGSSTRSVRSLFAYDATTREASPIVVPEDDGSFVVDAAIAPDASAIVYCLQQGSATNLRAIDFGTNPPTEAALTDDGASCHPVW